MSETGTAATATTSAVKNDALRYVTEQLAELRAKGVAPKLRVLEGEQKAVCTFDGREVINLASNNYLGLATHKALKKASIDAVKRLGVGAGAVRTIAGTMQIHMALEEQIARFKNVQACVVFQSGFTANAGAPRPIAAAPRKLADNVAAATSVLVRVRRSDKAVLC